MATSFRLPRFVAFSYDGGVAKPSRHRWLKRGLTLWACLIFTLPALVSLCSDAVGAAGHGCCGETVSCHNQVQAQTCCETQRSAPPQAPASTPSSPLTLGIFSLVAASDSPDFFVPFLSASPSFAAARGEIFLLKHSFLC